MNTYSILIHPKAYSQELKSSQGYGIHKTNFCGA